MDRLDVKILSALSQDRQASPAQSDIRPPIRKIARRLGVDEDTVRNRVARMKETGFLRGWALFPNPSIFGIRGAEIWTEVKSPVKKKAIDSLLKVPGVATVVNLMGAEVIIVIFYDGAQSPQEIQARVTKAAGLENSDFLEMSFPSGIRKLSETDIRICRLLQGNPLLKYTDIAKSASISERTVRRRVKWMVKENALFLQPSLNARALEGVVWTNILVFYDKLSKVLVDRRVLELAGESLVRAELNNPRYGFYTMFLPNLAASQELLEEVGGNGVARSRMGLVLDFFDSYEVFKDFIPGPRQ